MELSILFFSLAGLAGNRLRSTVPAHWPIVEGTIQQISVVRGEGRDRLLYVILAYSYFVEQYESGEIQRSFLSEAKAHSFAGKFRDRKLPVHVNPKNTSISIVLKQDLEPDSGSKPGASREQGKRVNHLAPPRR